jgi:hypothetical protein
LAARVGATAAWALAEFGPTYDGSQPCAGDGDTRPAPTLRTIYPQRTAS